MQRPGRQRQPEGIAVRTDPRRSARRDHRDPKVAARQRDRTARDTQIQTSDLERKERSSGGDRRALGGHRRTERLRDHIEARDRRVEQRTKRNVDARTADLNEIISSRRQPRDAGKRPVVDLTADRPRVVGEAEVRAVRMQRSRVQRQTERITVSADPRRSARRDHRDPKVAARQRDRTARDTQIQTSDLERKERSSGGDRRALGGHRRTERLRDHIEARDRRVEQRTKRNVDARTADLNEIISSRRQPGHARERPVVDLTADRPRVVGERQPGAIRVQDAGVQGQAERIAMRTDPRGGARRHNGHTEIAVAQRDCAARDRQRQCSQLQREQRRTGRNRSSLRRHRCAQCLRDRRETSDRSIEQRSHGHVDVRAGDFDQVVRDGRAEPGHRSERPVVDLVAGWAAVVVEAHRAERGEGACAQRQSKRVTVRRHPAVRAGAEDCETEVAARETDRSRHHREPDPAELEREERP